jgi:small redox-active disulfide protein 2
MRRVQIYGPGCAKCERLRRNVETAIHELGLDCKIEKITDIGAMAEAGVLMTPGLAIDGEVVSVGHLLSVTQVKRHLAAKNA